MKTRKVKIAVFGVICVIALLVCIFFIKNVRSEDAQVSNEDNHLKGKQMVMFGDSITQKDRDIGKSYSNTVAELTGLEVTNIGLGGTAMSIHPQEDFNAFSFYSLTDAIISKNYDKQKQALGNEEIPRYFEDTLTDIQKIDWNEVEYISILYGANDWGKPIENDEDVLDVNTFKGAARYGIDALLKAYPHLEIIFIPTPYRFWPDYGNVDSDTSVNALGLKPSQYSDAMMELANEYNYPYADTFYGLGINKSNRELYFDGIDGTHPNSKGLELIGKSVAKTLLNEY